ncbi:NIPSNAP family protein [Phenylobacterium sp.]|uniref:NIPSNAP family protein n=1 Tax=Phenylobacterium sp. TaxID=1871053 RepID=UPI002FCB2244
MICSAQPPSLGFNEVKETPDVFKLPARRARRGVFALTAWTAPASAAPVHQLRIYAVAAGQEAAFHARVRDHAARIMKRHDFKIQAMWEAKAGSKTEFVYLLEWPDREVMAERWAGFMADKEWSDIKAKSREEHGPVMGAIQTGP